MDKFIWLFINLMNFADIFKKKTNKKLGNTNKKNKIIEKPSVVFVNHLLNKCVYSDHFNLIEDFNELHYFR